MKKVGRKAKPTTTEPRQRTSISESSLIFQLAPTREELVGEIWPIVNGRFVDRQTALDALHYVGSMLRLDMAAEEQEPPRVG